MNRGTLWADDEVLTLIKVWGNDKVQEELDGATRNKVIFAKISEEMKKEGYNCDWQQCRGKIKNLKGEYRPASIPPVVLESCTAPELQLDGSSEEGDQNGDGKPHNKQ